MGEPVQDRDGMRRSGVAVVAEAEVRLRTEQNEVWAGQRSDAVAAAIRARVPPGLSGMDYGCGPGHIGLRLAGHFARLALIDADPHVVNVLAEKIAGRPSLHARRWDLTRQPTLDEVDCVFACMSFHHVADTPALLRGIFRTVRPGGWLVIADFDADHGQLHSAEPGFDAHHGFDRAVLAAQVAAYGFTEIHVDDVWAGQRWCGDLLVDYSLFLLTARRPTGEWTTPEMAARREQPKEPDGSEDIAIRPCAGPAHSTRQDRPRGRRQSRDG